MERLTKREMKILAHLNKAFPFGLKRKDLLDILDKPEAILDIILDDIKFLKNKGLVTVSSGDASGDVLLNITPEGRRELRENFSTRLYDSIRCNPLTTITTVIAILSVVSNIFIFSENSDLQKQNIALQKQNLDLQNQIKQENELRQIRPPTVWLTQDFSGSFEAGLNITPTLYFFKNSDKHFTIVNFEPNITLNGKSIGRTGGGYKARFRDEGIPEGKMVFLSFIPNYDFNLGINDLIIDYVLDIKDMDSQIRYRGNVTTEINSSSNLLKFPSGNEPVIFNWTKI